MRKLFLFLLSFVLCFSLVACTNNNDDGDSGDGGNQPSPNALITPIQLQEKIDAITASETLKLDSGKFDVLTFNTGVDNGQVVNGKPLYVRELDTVVVEGKVEEQSKTTFLKSFKISTLTTVNEQSIALKTTIKTLKFKDVNFTENIQLVLNFSSLENRNVYIENLVFENVSINNVDMADVTGRHGVSIETNCGAVKNVSFINSQIINVNSKNASGLHFNNAVGIEKITLQNTKIAGINYNAVQVNKFGGELTIDNCITSFTGSRALRIDDIREGAKITITNNRFEAASSDEVFKISNVHNSTIITISNNTLNGADLTYDDYVIA